MKGIRDMYEVLVRKGAWEEAGWGVLGMDVIKILKLILDWGGGEIAYIWHKSGCSDWLL
jgi:hypothetical protein